MHPFNKTGITPSMDRTHSTATPGTIFGLLRHGQTLWNVEKKIQGFNDSPLSENGRRQTVLWSKTLQQYAWDHIVASDLGRVRETVAILNLQLHLPVYFDTRLREQGWGEWEGLTIPYIEKNFQQDLARRIALGWNFSAPGGETRQAVRDRVLSALAEAGGKWPGQKILVICHQGVIKALLYHITGRAFMPGEDPLLQHDRFHLISLVAERFTPLKFNIPQIGKQ
jgi:broad specificity phosphatase PhoE